MNESTKASCIKRLSRIEGQVRGLSRMVEEDRYCIDVVTQVTAIQAALDKVGLELLSDHAAHCVAGAEGDRRERTDELMGAVRRLLRRVEQEILRDHVGHCVKQAMRSDDRTDQQRKIEELMDVLARSGG